MTDEWELGRNLSVRGLDQPMSASQFDEIPNLWHGFRVVPPMCRIRILTFERTN
jgi:hypothetical protein